jgi:hypothetical protein
MEPDRVGRKVGIGVRVASGILRDRAAQTVQTIQQDAPARLQQGAARSKTAATGAKKFGQSIWGQFAHAGSVLWLEITGLFFALFSLFFIQGVYRLRADWRTGPSHQRFLIYAVVAIVFMYFAISSFYRAHRRQQKRNMELRQQ